MTINVLFFAALAAQIGKERICIELADGAAVSDLLDVLSNKHVPIAQMRNQLATAVNMAYVGVDHPLSDGDELALIPPVSGG